LFLLLAGDVGVGFSCLDPFFCVYSACWLFSLTGCKEISSTALRRWLWHLKFLMHPVIVSFKYLILNRLHQSCWRCNYLSLYQGVCQPVLNGAAEGY
jgi:hypothetical protein